MMLCLPHKRCASDGLGHKEQTAEIDGGVPPVVVLAVACDAYVLRPGVQGLNLYQCLLHFCFGANDADQVLHGFLQVILNLVGILAGRAAIENVTFAVAEFSKRSNTCTARLCSPGGKLRNRKS